MIIKDQLNRTLSFTEVPNRIVSLVPSQTELLVDLGLKDNIVGITKFCVHPIELRKEKIVVGGTKEVNYNKIKALDPDLIICNKEENTELMVSELEKITSVWISDIYEIEDCLAMIDSFGEIFKIQARSKLLTENIIDEMNQFSDYMSKRPKQKVVYLIWKNPYMCAGTNTFINTMLKLNQFDNLATHYDSRYPAISLEEMRGADVVLLSSEPFPFKENDVSYLKKELGVKVSLVDGEYFSWYGSRIKDAFNYFKKLH